LGNLANFRREVDPVPPDPVGSSWSSPPAGNDHSETFQAPLRQDYGQKKSASWTFFLLFRHLTRFARGVARTTRRANPDGYALVLLADQELTAGRDNQAKTLLDAAYTAFDRQADGRSGAAPA
jgi:hypothetical protein